MADRWTDGSAYDDFIGRWSRRVAREFLSWLGLPRGAQWLDFGCGTGALTQTILDSASPRRVIGCDRAPAYVEHARRAIGDSRASFSVAELPELPSIAGGFDAAVSGLVLNFLPEPADGVAAMMARVRRGGTVAAYVWDYAGKMELLRIFWDHAVALEPESTDLDEARRFPLCRSGALEALFRGAGLRDVAAAQISVPTVFRDFDDYWSPFLMGQGPAPGYVQGLAPGDRDRLRAAIQASLLVRRDGAIALTARAWAVRGGVA